MRAISTDPVRWQSRGPPKQLVRPSFLLLRTLSILVTQKDVARESIYIITSPSSAPSTPSRSPSSHRPNTTCILRGRKTMQVFVFILVALLAFTCARKPKVCIVKAIGGGQDDGPNINAAFKRCSTDARVILDGYYVVDTLFFTINLKNVDILLSGTGMHYTLSFFIQITNAIDSAIHSWHREMVPTELLSHVPECVRLNISCLWIFTHIHLHRLVRLSGSYLEEIFVFMVVEPLMETARFGGIHSISPRYLNPFFFAMRFWDLSNHENAGTAGGSSRTFARPIPLTVGNSSNVIVEDITQIGSPFWVRRFYVV